MLDASRERIISLVQELLRATRDGGIAWRKSDRRGAYLFTGNTGSVRIENVDPVGVGQGPVRLVVYDAHQKEQLSHTSPGLPSFAGTELDRLLQALYAEVSAGADESLKIVDALITEVKGLGF